MGNSEHVASGLSVAFLTVVVWFAIGLIILQSQRININLCIPITAFMLVVIALGTAIISKVMPLHVTCLCNPCFRYCSTYSCLGWLWLCWHSFARMSCGLLLCSACFRLMLMNESVLCTPPRDCCKVAQSWVVRLLAACAAMATSLCLPVLLYPSGVSSFTCYRMAASVWCGIWV